MRRVRYLVAAGLDGQIALADGSFECFAVCGNDHVADYLESIQQFAVVIMGRKTYEVALRIGVTDPYPALETYVFSGSIQESLHANVHVIATDPAEFVKRMTAGEGGPIYLCGGGKLAATLLNAGLIGEVSVKLNPLITGPGIALFAGVDRPVRLNLSGSKTYRNGVVVLTYTVRNAGLEAGESEK